MKLGFIFDSEFDVLTPFIKNIGNAESAVVYLAIELAKLGHNITIFSRNSNDLIAFGVRCRSMAIVNQALNLDKAILEPDYDSLIVVNNSPEFITNLRPALPYKTNMFLWTEYTHKDPINFALNTKQVADSIDGIICVSDWQRSNFISRFSLAKDQVAVRYYAIAPFYENLFVDGKEFIAAKSKTPLFAYTTDPLSGLELLLESYDDVYSHYPDALLHVYEPAAYKPTDPKKLAEIYEQADKTKGLKRLGMLSNVQTVAHLSSHTIMAYPCTTEQSACIPIMNAMAAGLYIITSNLGGLPEYCSEHGKCIIEKNLHSESLDSFIGQVLAVCQSQAHSASSFFDYCYKQTADMNKKHTWRVRAREWVHMLSNVT